MSRRPTAVQKELDLQIRILNDELKLVHQQISNLTEKARFIVDQIDRLEKRRDTIGAKKKE